jgi:hypothetical protein
MAWPLLVADVDGDVTVGAIKGHDKNVVVVDKDAADPRRR